MARSGFGPAVGLGLLALLVFVARKPAAREEGGSADELVPPEPGSIVLVKNAVTYNIVADLVPTVKDETELEEWLDSLGFGLVTWISSEDVTRPDGAQARRVMFEAVWVNDDRSLPLNQKIARPDATGDLYLMRVRVPQL